MYSIIYVIKINVITISSIIDYALKCNFSKFLVFLMIPVLNIYKVIYYVIEFRY